LLRLWIGTEKDDTKAVKWYNKSTKQDSSAAPNNLGFCYYKGQGVEQDIIKGFSLFEQSAHLGHSTGMFSVGICFEEGAGVVKDENKAKEWYVKAVAHGMLEAQTKFDALNAA
jgi:TPR repeat protein